jgi:hypothetical protein
MDGGGQMTESDLTKKMDDIYALLNGESKDMGVSLLRELIDKVKKEGVTK